MAQRIPQRNASHINRHVQQGRPSHSTDSEIYHVEGKKLISSISKLQNSLNVLYIQMLCKSSRKIQNERDLTIEEIETILAYNREKFPTTPESNIVSFEQMQVS